MNDNLLEKWLEWKPKIILFGCLVVSFASGYLAGTGKDDNMHQPKQSVNYNTNQVTHTNSQMEIKDPQKQAENCLIKGNISSKGVRTYHIQGGSFYDRTIAEECFATEEEAVGKGYQKSSR